MVLIIIVVFIILFIANLLVYWILYFTTPRKITKSWDLYSKVYELLWSIPLIMIPVLGSSFLSPYFGTPSYFKGYWVFFLAIGLIFLGLGIKMLKLSISMNRIKGLGKGKHRLISSGIYARVRHPIYSAWGFIFIGLAYCLDSLIAIFLSPLFILILWIMSIIEEKYILLPLFKNEYTHYAVETQRRLYPAPYNAFLIIFAVLTAYVGFVNYDYLFL